MRISDWSSDVCSADLVQRGRLHRRDDRVGGVAFQLAAAAAQNDAPAARCGVVGDGGVAVAAPVAQGVAGAGRDEQRRDAVARPLLARPGARFVRHRQVPGDGVLLQSQRLAKAADGVEYVDPRSEEHTSELQSLMRISYAVFCLTKKNN